MEITYQKIHGSNRSLSLEFLDQTRAGRQKDRLWNPKRYLFPRRWDGIHDERFYFVVKLGNALNDKIAREGLDGESGHIG